MWGIKILANNTLNKESDKLNCFSFSKRDLVILLMIFNTTYYFFVCLVRRDLMGCLITAVTVGLIVLLTMTLRDIFQKLYEEIYRLRSENIQLRQSFRDEYQRIHRVKRKHELIKSNNLDVNAEETIISSVDDPLIHFYNSDLNNGKVHINYLNRFGTDGKSQNIQGNNPTG